MHVDLSKTIFGTLFVDDKINVVDILVESELCSSKREAREKIKGGAVFIGGQALCHRGYKITDVQMIVNDFPTTVWCGKRPRTIAMEESK